MRPINVIWHIILSIIMPFAIIILSSNLVLRLPEMYVYHFNDTRAPSYASSQISGSEFAGYITGYFNSPTQKDLQIYEQNGTYKDSLLENDEIEVMHRAKHLMTVGLAAGTALMAISVALFIYLHRISTRKGMRISGNTALCITVVELIAVLILVNNEGMRSALYRMFIGTQLNDDAVIKILLSSPLETSFTIFEGVLASVMTAVWMYINIVTTKEKRLFS